MNIMDIDFCEDGSQGKGNPMDVAVNVEIYATINLNTTLESSCPESKVTLVVIGQIFIRTKQG